MLFLKKKERTFLTYLKHILLKPQVSLGPPGVFTGPKEATCLANQIISGSREARTANIWVREHDFVLQFAHPGNNCILSWTHIWTTAQMSRPHPVRVQLYSGSLSQGGRGLGTLGSLQVVHKASEGWGGVGWERQQQLQ